MRTCVIRCHLRSSGPNNIVGIQNLRLKIMTAGTFVANDKETCEESVDVLANMLKYLRE